MISSFNFIILFSTSLPYSIVVMFLDLFYATSVAASINSFKPSPLMATVANLDPYASIFGC